MSMKINHELPLPEVLKSQYPLSQELKEVKKQRDEEIRRIFTGESDKFIVLVGPCSADNEDTVCEYVRKLKTVADKVSDKLMIIPRVYTNKPRTTGDGYKGMLHQPDPDKAPDLLAGIIAIRKMHMRVMQETGLSSADEMLYPENRSYLGRWTVREGAELSYSSYTNRTFQRLFTDETLLSDYRTRLGIVGWGLFAGADYASQDKRFTASLGLRADGNDYSPRMARLWHQLSPRASVGYRLGRGWSLSGSAGLYYQLPPYTALGFKEADAWVNKSLHYMRVGAFSAGVGWRLRDRLIVSVEGFYKLYGDIPLSVADGIPLSCKGNDYGVVGNEELRSSAEGRSYGVEAMARWQIPGKVNLVGSVTLFRSEYRRDSAAPYIVSAWDSRFVVNLSGTYDLPRSWSVGARLSAVGGTPYTPYDVGKSSLVEAWDAQGRPYYDYARYNDGRLDAFAQLDLRIDKTFYFRHCMLGLYIDLQNVTGSKLRQPDVLMSTGVVENPEAPAAEQRYRMKYIRQESGTLIPTLGITVEF